MTLPSAGPFTTVWANQWEPPGTVGRQFAARCYQERFGEEANLENHMVQLSLEMSRGDSCLCYLQVIMINKSVVCYVQTEKVEFHEKHLPA